MIFPDAKVTKGELADYYRAIGAPMAVVDRQPADQPGPLPAGPRQEMLLPEARQRHVRRRTSTMSRSARRTGTSEDYLYVEDSAGVLACVQMGTIEFHGWGSKVADVEKPDRIVFDLDPDVGLDFDAGQEGGEGPARPISPTWASPPSRC